MMVARLAEQLYKRYLQFLGIITTVALTLVRQPELLFLPRFYAEEGQSFFAFAYNHNFSEYVFTPIYGYYALYNVIVTSFASLFPLETAPLITTYAALVVQIFVSAFPLFADIPILDSVCKRGIVGISFLLLCPAQTWLTTIGVQFWFCILTALIMIERPTSKCTSRDVANASLLVLTGMTGVLSCMMTPLFIVKAIMTKARQFILYSAILLTTSAVQVCIFATAFLKHDPTLSTRFVSRNEPLMSYIYSQVVLFFSKFLITEHSMDIPIVSRVDSFLTRMANISLGRDFFAQVETTFFLISVFIAFVTLVLAYKFKNHLDYMLLVIATGVIFPLSVFLSVNSIGGHRYRFVPMSILMVFFVSCINKAVIGKADRIFLGVFICLILMCQFVDFRASMHKVYNESWPRWSAEVAHWRSDSGYHMKIWPPPWEMVLIRAGEKNSTKADTTGEPVLVSPGFLRVK